MPDVVAAGLRLSGAEFLGAGCAGFPRGHGRFRGLLGVVIGHVYRGLRTAFYMLRLLHFSLSLATHATPHPLLAGKTHNNPKQKHQTASAFTAFACLTSRLLRIGTGARLGPRGPSGRRKVSAIAGGAANALLGISLY